MTVHRRNMTVFNKFKGNSSITGWDILLKVHIVKPHGGSSRRSERYIFGAKWMSVKHFVQIHQIDAETFHEKSESFDLLVKVNEVMGSPESWGFVLWAPWIPLPKFLALYKKVVKIFYKNNNNMMVSITKVSGLQALLMTFWCCI